MGVDKSDVLKKMREAEAIYVLMSDCTRMPFVVCDPETYDDQVLIFFSEEEAMKGGQEFLKEGNPLKIFNIENKYMLPFYSSLFPAGVNGMWVGKDTEEEIKLQLTELVRRPEQKPGEEPIENPSFQITAMYFMQKARKQKEMKITEDMKDLQEELMAHYQDATFITAVTEEKKMPVLNKNDGQVLLPLFSYHYGAGDNRRNREILKCSIVVSVSIMAVATGIFFVFPEKLIQIFSTESAIVAIGKYALPVISISFIFAGLTIVITSYLQGIAHIKISLFIIVLRQIFLLVPLAWMFHFIGLNAVWWFRLQSVLPA